MSQRRITISVPAAIADKASRAVAAGVAESVSAYFAQLAAREPDWVQAQAALDELIADAGGLSPDDVSWARAVLGMADDTGVSGAA